MRPYTHQINATVGRILKRFRLPQDIQERFCVRIDNLNIMRYRLEARDGQPERNAFSTFSTGQLNQVGVSLMLALNLGAGENHPLGFICFDDISAAFDPSNLTASALLFRALAYDRRGPQKQIFITSHHDDTTTRLLPLLLPPEGCRMKVIEFLPWSETHGAKVKCYDVAGASKNWKEQLRHLSLPSSKSQPRS
ncbi:MAG: hypothetical protein H5U00_12190 [Clostridia bacterium]|nr:hypothetical protein [Clostridia bacterium]